MLKESVVCVGFICVLINHKKKKKNRKTKIMKNKGLGMAEKRFPATLTNL